MNEDEAKNILRQHFNGDISNVKNFLDAIRVAEAAVGPMTLEELEEWSKKCEEKRDTIYR